MATLENRCGATHPECAWTCSLAPGHLGQHIAYDRHDHDRERLATWGRSGPTPSTVLDKASAIVDGARRESYGTPRENHERTAAMWSAYLGVVITARQVCMLNILQKVSRDAHRSGEDNLIDIAGYVRNIELLDK